MRLGAQYLSLFICLCLVPLCLYTGHADCYVTHQSTAQGGDTNQMTRGKHVQRYVGLLINSPTNTQLTFLSTRVHALQVVQASLCFLCFASRLCACLCQRSCQPSASGKSNYGPRSSLVLMPKGADAALVLAARAAVTSDQVVTLMEEGCSVCLCQ